MLAGNSRSGSFEEQPGNKPSAIGSSCRTNWAAAQCAAWPTLHRNRSRTGLTGHAFLWRVTESSSRPVPLGVPLAGSPPHQKSASGEGAAGEPGWLPVPAKPLPARRRRQADPGVEPPDGTGVLTTALPAARSSLVPRRAPGSPSRRPPDSSRKPERLAWHTFMTPIWSLRGRAASGNRLAARTAVVTAFGER